MDGCADCRAVRCRQRVDERNGVGRLFDVIAPTLRAAIRAVYKSGVLKPCDVERRIRLPNGYCAEAYTLPMVVAIAFRINTPKCRKGTQRPVGKAVLAKRQTSAIFLFVAKCFVNGFLLNGCLGRILQNINALSSLLNNSKLSDLPASLPEYVMVICMSAIYYFDELMKYI